MGKVSQNQSKYTVKAKLESKGRVEKPDVVGAIFGQTEGILGEDLDLRELQERGRVGRIDVNVGEENGRSVAEIEIPSSLDSADTALVGAALETIERVGPTEATIEVEEIKDERTSKREYIVDRAKELMNEMQDEKPETNKISSEIKQELRTEQITEFYSFRAGPEAEISEEVILVEGKADLLNLLKHGVKNCVALGGTDIPDEIEKIGGEKKITVFLDGDRGGDLILKELKDSIEPDYICRAPEKKEVEELGKEKIYEALRDKSKPKFADDKVGKKEVAESDK